MLVVHKTKPYQSSIMVFASDDNKHIAIKAGDDKKQTVFYADLAETEKLISELTKTLNYARGQQ